MTIFEMVKNESRFKAFCRCRSVARRPTAVGRFKKAQKAFQSELRAISKRRGKWSILKDPEYTTGREYISPEYRYAQLARIEFHKASGEFFSVITNEPAQQIPDEAA